MDNSVWEFGSLRDQLQTYRAEPSCVSMKSSHPTHRPPDLSTGETGIHPRFQKYRVDFPDPSFVSMKSSHSMLFEPPDLSTGGTGFDPRFQKYRVDFPDPSFVSMKSSHSMLFEPPDLSTGGTGFDPRFQKYGAEFPDPSCVSMKSSNSMLFEPPDLSTGGTGFDPRLYRQRINKSWNQSASSGAYSCPQSRKRYRRRPVLKPHTEQDSSRAADGVLQRVSERHKTCMKDRYESLFEGIKTEENKTLLNRIYTQLYIIEGESEGVNEEHEILQMEKKSRKHLQDTPISYLDIFKPLEDPKEEQVIDVMGDSDEHKEPKEDQEPKQLRTVLTKGIAGIGKTVSVQKFILDWAEGKENQDVDLMFVLPFRELNLMKDYQYSLHGLLWDFHPEIKDLDPETIDKCKAVFLFDGLDENRIPLNFSECEKVCDTTMTSSVGVLITNLVKGELLRSAHIWITSRPAAANQIPSQYINRVTEIQGFSDPQKEEYFRKRISDEDQARRIISHIKTARSLHIMCHIPVFCWISATVLQRIMKQGATEIPRTLTEMYAHFLRTQTHMKNEKYEEKEERDPKNLLKSNRTMLLKLAGLAFKQLMKGNVMFYEEDLRECGIDVTEASVYSGVCTEIFKEECVLHQRKVYCFVHLSFQEFLAALYVFHCYASENMEELQVLNPQNMDWSMNDPLHDVLIKAVDKAVESENGHLDLFLRFLLGISLGSNQKLLQGLLTQQTSSESISKTVQHIKRLIRSDDLPAERSINLFLCLTEMNDQSLCREIQEYLKSEKCSEAEHSPAHCSAIAYMLQVSEEVLEELDLKKFNTSEEGYRSKCRKALFQFYEAECPDPSCVSMKSSHSMARPPDLSTGGTGFDPRLYINNYQDQSASSGAYSCPQFRKRSRRRPKKRSKRRTEQDSHRAADGVLQRFSERHKTCMKYRYESLFEGIKTEENKTLLNRIYTQLYIIEGESEGVNEEHEVLQMEKTSRKQYQNTPVSYLDIFKPLEDPKGEQVIDVMGDSDEHNEPKEDQEPKQLRTVLTKGIAGIGKTVSVQKFILDWAEGKENQDVDLMFVLPFRELNLIIDYKYSLHGLLCDFHPEIKDLDPKTIDMCKAVFIFDGLDESRIPLNFSECEKVCDPTVTSSVGELITTLIKGELLPSAHIWITSRPAAANQIPPQYINRVTEIQGFSDPQKEEYFRKRISNKDQARRIISHIKTARSLHIMCHIPVFCLISATVLQQIMKQGSTEIPKTLTQMYSHFLLTQTHMKNDKYKGKDERDPKNLLESNRTMLLKLAELAFKQLMIGNVMFYEEDLRECGIDVTEASVYSGICTEIFKEECVIHQRKIYCFVHLSFQEFLAALYVFHCYASENMEELQVLNPQNMEWSTNDRLHDVLIKAVGKAVESKDGHLDLFLRFLLGISLGSNQEFLQGLLKYRRRSSKSIIETVQHIKNLIQSTDLPAERSINLFLCLTEMNDQSLSREIQEYLKSEKCSETKLSPAHCSAIAYMLQVSEEVLEELDLKKFNTSEEGYRRLVPAVSKYRKAVLANCNLTKNECEILSSDLKSASSVLKELDLSNNELHDSGVELLSAGLKSSHCKLETLRLAVCKLSTQACDTLRSVFQSENCSLKTLDLSSNDLHDSGVELLSAGLKSSHCKLEILRLAMCKLSTQSCDTLQSVFQSENCYLKTLDLSNNDLHDSGVELLSAGLKSSQCKLDILRLAMCKLSTQSCDTLQSVFQSENCSLKTLDLSNNDLHDSGVELLSAGLKSSHCTLEILRLSGCMITEKGCSSLASALSSNPTQLKELDLTYNHPGKSIVKLTSDGAFSNLRLEHGGENRIKPGLKKYSCEVTLDPNTTHRVLSLSDENRKVERVGRDQPYPDHPERFDYWYQVLSRESLTGRCYWEAEWSGVICISVSYKSISRKGNSTDSGFGQSVKSWSIECCNNSYSVYHNNIKTDLSVRLSDFKRVGVYVDCPAGTLSFYRVSSDPHTLTHLHTFYTSFTEPLYVGFGLCNTGCSVFVR